MKMNCLFAALAAILFLNITAYSQNIAINEDGSLPNPNAILDVKSFNKGILIPRVSSTGRLSIPNTKGLLVYDTTSNSFWYNTGAAWQNIGAAAASGWLLHGNSGTDTSSFLGTTDSKPLVIRVNNQRSGLIDSSKLNTFWGYNAGKAITNATNNTAIGYNALIRHKTGIANVAVGSNALWLDSAGFANTAVGESALVVNGTGTDNTAVGYQALGGNTNGSNNTAIGSFSMFSAFPGSFNTAVGFHTLGFGSVVGDFNTLIGSWADVPQGGQLFNNCTAIGATTIVLSPNKVRIGNGAVVAIEGQVPFTVPSDGRFKFQVQEDVKGLDFIMQLRPVTYQFNTKQFDEQQNSFRLKDTGYARVMQSLQPAYTESGNIRRSGFIAQEVEKAVTASGYDFSGLIRPKTAQDYYSLSYESFVVPLVKAVQEQNQVIADLKKQVAELKQLIMQSK